MMGVYLQTPQPLGKADQLLTKYGGDRLEGPTLPSTVAGNKAVVVVVDNGHFEAAGWCFDDVEYQNFTAELAPRRGRSATSAIEELFPGIAVVDMDAGRDGPRPMEWLLLDRSAAEDASGMSYSEIRERYGDREPQGDYLTFVVCGSCKKECAVSVDPTGYAEWRSGEKRIQEAMPELSAADRELLISATCGDCFERMFA